MSHELVIDIETAPVQPFRELTPQQQHYLMDRPAGYGNRETADQRLNLTPLYGKVITIGVWLVKENKGCILFEGEENAWIPELDIADMCFSGDEATMLEAFWKIVAKYPGRIITWNGRWFDLPFLYLRSAIHGIKPARNILGQRYTIDPHCDLFEVATFFGATKITGYNLESYCHAFGIDNPKEQLSGKDVAEAYLEGPIEEIAEYCMRDVAATLELYRKLLPMMQVMTGKS